MKIAELQYENKALDWRLDRTTFANLTLLVGISGVGKTQILDAIWTLKRIAEGNAPNGVKWDVLFATKGADQYRWEGEFEQKEVADEVVVFGSEDDPKNRPNIQHEELSRNGVTIVSRSNSEIRLKGKKTPKLAPFESVLSLLSLEEEIAPASESFKRIIRSEYSDYKGRKFTPELLEYSKMLSRNVSLEEIQESTLDSGLKIALVYKLLPELFNQIKYRFIDIFPQVEDVRFAPHKNQFLPFMTDEVPLLEIKEKGVKDWIQQRRLSSGMYKTFMHLSEMHLWKEGTVVLIDEFENSLGINCINVLTEELLQENRRLQFIITSHHPYIINNIRPEYWKVVTRKGGVVTTEDASSLRLDSSSHQAFIQLINRDVYKEGIAS